MQLVKELTKEEEKRNLFTQNYSPFFKTELMPKILIESPFANEPVDNEALFKFS